MEAKISIKKKLLGKNEFIIKEIESNKTLEYKFTSKDQLVDFIKDNIPVNDKEYKVSFDAALDGNNKLLLKHSTEKAGAYQKQHGFDKEALTMKKEILNAISQDIKNANPEEKLDIINNKTEALAEKKKTNTALLALTADYCVEVYQNIFSDSNSNIESKDNVLNKIRNTLNILISQGYETHNYKENVVDLISMRNNLARIAMNKQNRLRKKISKKKQ